MKKNIIFFVGLFLLTACGGGSGGGGSGNTGRQPIVNNNHNVTSLSTSVDNRAEIIAFVEGYLGENYYTDGGNTTPRPSPRVSANNPGNSYTSDAYEKYMKKYNNAAFKISDLNMIFSLSRAELQEMFDADEKIEVRLKDSLILVGIIIPDSATFDDLLDLAAGVNHLDVQAIINANKLKTVKLDEVDFKYTKGVNPLKFNLNTNGQIISITTSGNTLDRVGDSGSFTKTDKNKEQTITLESYGKKVGLSFSDFGNLYTNNKNFDGNGILTTDSNSLNHFIAGYDSKRVNDTEIAKNMTFKGHAVGNVNNSFDGSKLQVDGTATLDFKKGGEQTLTANFTNWYDTILTKNTDGTFDIAFDNARGVDIKDSLKMNGSDDIQSLGGSAEINYYGDGGKAAEASGMIHYNEGNTEFQSAFGVKKVD